jgi:hypothetical protein
VGVERSVKGSLQRWCRFNASVSTREKMQQDEELLKDEAGAASSFWLNRKEM